MNFFIKLTSNVEQKEVLVNAAHIVSMMSSPSSNGTTLKLSTSQHFYVEEDMETIKGMIFHNIR